MCFMFHQRLSRYLQQCIKQACTTETERMDTGPSLNTIGQNAINDKSVLAVEVHIESRRMDAGSSLDTIDQNATNDQSAVEAHIESGRMDAGPSLDTIDQNTTNDQSGRMDAGLSLDTVEQHAINNEQDNEDQIASRELGENRKSAAEVLKDSIEKEKLDALFTHFNEIMDNWKNEPVKLVVTGKSGVWKSAFINAILNLKPGYPGFTTTSSFGNTTIHATVFKFPRNSEIALHELPSFGTTEFPTNEYQEKMELHKYDSVLIFVRNIEENDIEIAKKLKEMNKPVCFVRSKHDLDIENAKNYGEPAAEAIEKMKSKSLDILRQEGFKEAKFFVISNRSRMICDFNALVLYIQSNLPKLKCDVVMFSLLGNLTGDMIDSKHKILKDRIWDVSLASVGPAATPVPGLDVMLDLALICKEIWLYHNVFGFGQQIVKEISKHDYLRKKLSVSYIIEIEAENEAMERFVIIQLRKLRTVMTVQNTLGVIPPFIGPVISGLTAGKVTHNLLTQILDGCRDDAKLVSSHLMKVNAEEHLIRTTQIVAKTK